MSTKIEWCDETINPVVGCTKVSPACKNCYAERMANRLANMPHTRAKYSQVVTNGKWNGNTVFDAAELQKPKKWKKPRRIFVTSMGDIFHDTVSFQDIIEIMFMVKENPIHTFIIITKRPERMVEFFNECTYNPFFEPLPNLWLGVTVENQEHADKRIPLLLEIKCAVHLVSCEPLLGGVNLQQYLPSMAYRPNHRNTYINWVIAGGETGPGFRDVWRNDLIFIMGQCRDSNTPFFFKGYGGKEKSKLMCGREYNEFPKL